MKITGDYHTHSQYSHGRGDIRQNVIKAVDKGLQEICITDHGPRSFSIVPLGIKKPQTILEIKKEIEKTQQEFPSIKILTGIEANIINEEGQLDLPDEALAQLDLIAAGFHLYIIPPDLKACHRIIFDNRITYPLFKSKRQQIRIRNTTAVINAVNRYSLDFITHPGYKVDIDTLALAEACAAAGTCLEINARHGFLIEDFVQIAAKTDVRFIINSDAHAPEEVGQIEPGLKLINQVKLDLDRVVNINI